MSAQAILLLAGSSALTGFIFGWCAGSWHGRNAQWCDDLFERIDRERARRDALGRFKKQRSNQDVTQ